MPFQEAPRSHGPAERDGDVCRGAKAASVHRMNGRRAARAGAAGLLAPGRRGLLGVVAGVEIDDAHGTARVVDVELERALPSGREGMTDQGVCGCVRL